MLRRGWCIVLAAFGCLAAASPPDNGSADQSNSPGSAVQKATQQLPASEQAGSQEYNPPCDAGSDDRKSDLCAQWKAADSAATAALWTERGFWLSLAGTTLLLWTLLYTARGTRAAVRAVEAQIAATRPLMQLVRIDLVPSRDTRPNFDLHWEMINYGQVGCWVQGLQIRGVGGTMHVNTDTAPNLEVTAFVGPGKTLKSLETDTIGIVNMDRAGLTQRRIVTVYGFVVYRDAGSHVWRTHFMHRVELDAALNTVRHYPVPSGQHWKDQMLKGSEAAQYLKHDPPSRVGV